MSAWSLNTITGKEQDLSDDSQRRKDQAIRPETIGYQITGYHRYKKDSGIFRIVAG